MSDEETPRSSIAVLAQKDSLEIFSAISMLLIVPSAVCVSVAKKWNNGFSTMGSRLKEKKSPNVTGMV